jgi:hypothetical protein
LDRRLIGWIFFFTVLRPIWEFTHVETSPLSMQSCKI